MKTENKAWYIERRGNLLAELFLQDLAPDYLASAPGSDAPFDYIATFTTPDGWQKTVAIEVKSTEREVKSRWQLSMTQVDGWTRANIPTLVIVVDVKRNKVFFNWANKINTNQLRVESSNQQIAVTIPLREANQSEIEILKEELFGQAITGHESVTTGSE